MILTFSKPEFVELIKKGIKIHTIREDKHNRWQQGMKIQFWYGNPRNKKSNPEIHQFGTGTCIAITDINIFPEKNVVVTFSKKLFTLLNTFTNLNDLNKLARADGFKNWEEMKKWFNESFYGKLIWFNFDVINK